jgi:hypothetical protein
VRTHRLLTSNYRGTKKMGDKEKNRSSAGGKTGKGVKNYAKGP